MASSGAVTDLTAVGVEDAYLSVDPEDPVFFDVYERPIKWVDIPKSLAFTQTVAFDKELTLDITRDSDLAGEAWLSVSLPTLPSHLRYKQDVGFALIEHIEFIQGANDIDHHTGEFYKIWSTLTQQPGWQLNKWVGHFDSVADREAFSHSTDSEPGRENFVEHRLNIPLLFFWNRHMHQYLRLVALSRNKSKLKLKLRALSQLVERVPPTMAQMKAYYEATGTTLKHGAAASEKDYNAEINPTNREILANVMINYIALREADRQAMAAEATEMLVDQLQQGIIHDILPEDSGKAMVDLTEFAHANIQHWILLQSRASIDGGEFFNYGIRYLQPGTLKSRIGHSLKRYKTWLNTHPKGDWLDATQAFDLAYRTKHSHMPSLEDGELFYANILALRPEMQAPTGEINISMLQSAKYEIETLLDRKQILPSIHHVVVEMTLATTTLDYEAANVTLTFNSGIDGKTDCVLTTGRFVTDPFERMDGETKVFITSVKDVVWKDAENNQYDGYVIFMPVASGKSVTYAIIKTDAGAPIDKVKSAVVNVERSVDVTNEEGETTTQVQTTSATIDSSRLLHPYTKSVSREAIEREGGRVRILARSWNKLTLQNGASSLELAIK